MFQWGWEAVPDDEWIVLEITTLRFKRFTPEIPVEQFCNQIFNAEPTMHKVVNDYRRISREYYYADHMNAILGVYTELDDVTTLQCDYLETLEKCEHIEKELSKSRTISKSVWKTLQKKLAILNLET
ncbi:hypothetical protein Tco_1294825 [Tanacetum coccineum]